MKVLHVSQTLLRWAGIDRAVAYTLLGRIWGLAAGLASLVLISEFLSKEEQGFYYTFSSILALQVLFDLGLAYVILQFASHEMRELSLGSNRVLKGNVKAKARMASLLRFAVRWYAVVAGLTALVIIPAGLYFFGTSEGNGACAAWRVPWTLLGVMTAGLLFASPLSAIVEGTGQVADVALMRTVQNVVSSTALWAALLLGWKLYAASICAAARLLCVFAWLSGRYGGFLQDLFAAGHPDGQIGWRREIWPFQWRIGVSWLSGYFIGQLFNPIMFAFHGAVAAGQMGMSLAVAGGVSSIALAWVNTKAAPFGQMIARRDFQQLDRTFFRCLWQSCAMVALVSAGAFLAVLYLRSIHHPFAQRVLDPLPFGLILLTMVLNHVVVSEAIYLRAHKEEPFLWTAVAIGALTALSAYLVGRPCGALGMAIAYLTVNLVVGLGVGSVIFVKKRRLWHGPEHECVLP